MVDACKKVVQSGIAPESITEEVIQQNLYVPDVPPLDLIVRTSGEHRLSNFMIWEGSYAELLFFDKPWPDLTTSDIDAILDEYKQRNRRFGG
jgi:undecaprenyl diphosphate synthase